MNIRRLVAMSLSTIGIIFIFATVFDVITGNIGYFLAVTCFALSGLAWAVLPKKENEKPADNGGIEK